MIRIFIGELLPQIPHTEILYPNLGNIEPDNPFGEKIFASFTEKVVDVVDDPTSADYLCLPHNYNYLKTKSEYISKFVELSEKHSKKILVFFPGDSNEEVPIKGAIVFRNSQYRHKKKANEIIMPGYAVDMAQKYGLEYRLKESIPVIGFCGWAKYSTIRAQISYTLVNLLNTFSPVYKKGLYFRRKALGILSKSDKVKTNFITRSVYGGSAKTINSDATLTRKEYVDNIKTSDFTLAPKGDGNFSVRFFEVLSLGRIPLLIDTDCILPLEHDIDYSKFILRVPYNEIDKIPEKVIGMYDSLTDEEYRSMQEIARRTFESHLHITSFFKFIFTEDNLRKYVNL